MTDQDKEKYFREIQTPKVKENALIWIGDQQERLRIESVLSDLHVGAVVVDEKIKEVARQEIFSPWIARFIDVELLNSISLELETFLVNSSTEVDPFIVVGTDVVLPFSHPKLVRWVDMDDLWLKKVIADAKAWDESECARYRREIQPYL